MKTVLLNEIASVQQGGKRGLSGKHFVSAGYPAYGAGGINGFLPEYEFEGAGVILSANGARCGKCFYAEGKWASLANTQVILPDVAKVMPKFLWYQLNDESKWHRAGTAQPFIKPSDVKNKKIVLPGLEEQSSIVKTLDLADGLRQKRCQSLQFIDDFLRAVFFEMFGDPLSKKPKFPVVRLGDVVDFCGGGTPSRAVPEYYQGQHKWASSKDMKGLILRDTQERVSEKAIENCATKLVKAGTLLIVVKSKILMRYLPVMIAGTEVCFNQDIKGITPSKEVNPWYLLFHLRIGQDALLRVARGANTEGLTLDHLREYALISAPKDLQDKFAGIAQKAVALSEKMQEGQSVLDNQFNSLTQKYFSGEAVSL